MDQKLINIRTSATEGMGALSFLEAGRDFPGEIKRIYYTYDVPVGVKRGGHAHHNLQQLLVCLYGEIEVILFDGETTISYLLDDPSKGVFVPEMTWHDMIWKKEGSVLMVAASDYYDEADYIRDHDMFLHYMKDKAAKKDSHQ